MSLIVLLDSGPLGLITNPRRTVEVIACEEWMARIVAAGATVCVPEVIDYEVRRELIHARKVNGLARLDLFVGAEPDRYIAITTDAMRLAAELWAQAR